jgi:hypothetical protein
VLQHWQADPDPQVRSRHLPVGQLQRLVQLLRATGLHAG